MFTKQFWQAATERAVKTAAQVTLTLFIVNGTVVGFDQVDWPAFGWIIAVSTAASVLTSIVSAAATNGQPSLASETIEIDTVPAQAQGSSARLHGTVHGTGLKAGGSHSATSRPRTMTPSPDPLTRRLELIASLEEGWDGGASRAPSREALAAVAFAVAGMDSTDIECSAHGDGYICLTIGDDWFADVHPKHMEIERDGTETVYPLDADRLREAVVDALA